MMQVGYKIPSIDKLRSCQLMSHELCCWHSASDYSMHACGHGHKGWAFKHFNRYTFPTHTMRRRLDTRFELQLVTIEWTNVLLSNVSACLHTSRFFAKYRADMAPSIGPRIPYLLMDYMAIIILWINVVTYIVTGVLWPTNPRRYIFATIWCCHLAFYNHIMLQTSLLGPPLEVTSEAHTAL